MAVDVTMEGRARTRAWLRDEAEWRGMGTAKWEVSVDPTLLEMLLDLADRLEGRIATLQRCIDSACDTLRGEAT